MLVMFSWGSKRLFRASANKSLAILGIFTAVLQAMAGEKFPVLKVNHEYFSNVVVTLVTSTDIYFSHSRGMANAKLKYLDRELQQRFHFDPAAGDLREREQTDSNIRYLATSITRALAPRVPPLGPGPRSSKVTVEVADPGVEYVFYDRGSALPPQIPKGMHGVTVHSFICRTEFTFRSNQKQRTAPYFFRIDEARISVNLPITITLPNGASEKLKAHEEGHRKIHEHFYAYATAAAQRAGELLIGKQFTSQAADFETAKDEMLAWAGGMVENEYWKYTREPSEQAGRYYDELTGHGSKSINAEEAALEATARYELPVPSERPGA